MTNFWQNKKVIVTGGYGFLGSHVCNLLKEKGCDTPFVFHSLDYNLKSILSSKAIFADYGKADILINLAANVGGIGYNQNHPYYLFYDNLMINTNLIHNSIGHVDKFIQVGTVCSYPKFARPPFREEMLWDGYPEETNAPYGLAKRMALIQLQEARKEFGFNGIYLIPTNLYGPGDEFGSDRSHVIPALINKCLEAKKHDVDHIDVWGNGNVTRDFLYVTDAAEAILLAAEKYDNGHPLNIGSGNEIRIASLVHRICGLTGYQGKIEYDTTRLEGQPRRALNTGEIESAIGWKATTPLKLGLMETIKWYRGVQ